MHRAGYRRASSTAMFILVIVAYVPSLHGSANGVFWPTAVRYLGLDQVREKLQRECLPDLDSVTWRVCNFRLAGNIQFWRSLLMLRPVVFDMCTCESGNHPKQATHDKFNSTPCIAIVSSCAKATALEPLCCSPLCTPTGETMDCHLMRPYYTFGWRVGTLLYRPAYGRTASTLQLARIPLSWLRRRWQQRLTCQVEPYLAMRSNNQTPSTGLAGALGTPTTAKSLLEVHSNLLH